MAEDGKLAFSNDNGLLAYKTSGVYTGHLIYKVEPEPPEPPPPPQYYGDIYVSITESPQFILGDAATGDGTARLRISKLYDGQSLDIFAEGYTTVVIDSDYIMSTVQSGRNMLDISAYVTASFRSEPSSPINLTVSITQPSSGFAASHTATVPITQSGGRWYVQGVFRLWMSGDNAARVVDTRLTAI